MHFKGRMELEHGLKPLDIAPLINIVFLLLIFFLLTSTFVIAPSIPVDLPRSVTAETMKYENLEILVTADNLIYLNGRKITTQDLNVLFKATAGKIRSILIKADGRASLGKVVEIWDLARALGIAQINIATNQE